MLLQRCLYLKTLDGADERKQCCAQYLSKSKLRIVICTRFTGFSSIVGILSRHPRHVTGSSKVRQAVIVVYIRASCAYSNRRNSTCKDSLRIHCRGRRLYHAGMMKWSEERRVGGLHWTATLRKPMGVKQRGPPMIRPHITRSLERFVGEFDPSDFLEECSARFYSNLALARQSRYPALLI